MTASRPPRGRKPEKSGEGPQRDARSGVAATSVTSSFPRAASRPTGRDAAFEQSTTPSQTIGMRRRRSATNEPREGVRHFGYEPGAFGRADAAYKAEFDRWQSLIDAALKDPSLSPTQRTMVVASLRLRQRLEAVGARRRVIEEEKHRLNAAKRLRRAGRSVMLAKPHL